MRPISDPRALSRLLILRLVRPGFLVVTFSACLIGWAAAWRADGAFDITRAVPTLLLALLAHAAGNVINDYEDHASGADAANTSGLYPFTGGSRLIQQGEVDPRSVRRIALVLLVICAAGGLAFALTVRPALLGLGAVGLLLAWAYSAPPLRLMARGVGEVVIAIEWWLVAVGACMAQLTAMPALGWLAGIGHAGLVAAILLVNGFPDAEGDAATGKRTRVVRSGPRMAAALCTILVISAHIASVLALASSGVASWAWPWVSLPLSLGAMWKLWRHVRHAHDLRGAIVLNIGASVVHALAVAAALVIG